MATAMATANCKESPCIWQPGPLISWWYTSHAGVHINQVNAVYTFNFVLHACPAGNVLKPAKVVIYLIIELSTAIHAYVLGI